MSHRRPLRHTAIRALHRLFTRSPRPIHTCTCGGALLEEPVGPLAAGHMRQRPGGVFQDTLLRPATTPHPALRNYRLWAEVRTTASAEGIEPGHPGVVSRLAPFRASKPIGVRLAARWGPLTWFDPEELKLVEADTVVIAAAVERVEGAWIAYASPADLADTRELDDLPLMGGAR